MRATINKRLDELENRMRFRFASEEFSIGEYYELLTSIMMPDEIAMVYQDLQNLDYIRVADIFKQVVLDFPRELTSQELKKTGVDMKKFKRMAKRIEEGEKKPSKVLIEARKQEERVRHERNQQAPCPT